MGPETAKGQGHEAGQPIDARMKHQTGCQQPSASRGRYDVHEDLAARRGLSGGQDPGGKIQNRQSYIALNGDLDARGAGS